MAVDISLRQLEYFLAVVDTGSMSAAAVRCHASSLGLKDVDAKISDLLLSVR